MSADTKNSIRTIWVALACFYVMSAAYQFKDFKWQDVRAMKGKYIIYNPDSIYFVRFTIDTVIANNKCAGGYGCPFLIDPMMEGYKYDDIVK